MWRIIRTTILVLILIWAAGHTWLDRVASTQWKATLWVGVFPINADSSARAQTYIDGLSEKEFTDVETFFTREAHRYGKTVTLPVHVALYREVRQLPPQLERNAGLLATAWWSLKTRWFAWRAADAGGKAPPRIRMFVLYHDPTTLRTVPDSHGLQKGLIGIVHAFAIPAMAGSNNIILAHELLHTLGATDKYDLNSGAPLVPAGIPDPTRQPLYPQAQAEIMAGTRALATGKFEMPASLRDVVAGPETAAEVKWTRH